MKQEFERKTVFLYPESERLEYEQIKTTNRLITNINFIVYSANNLIKNILTSGNFSFVNCFPSVMMHSICDEIQEFHDCNNVRICITGYNTIDYSRNYLNIIEKHKNNSSDISHLVAIHIRDKLNKPKFLVDVDQNFDVKIESDLEHLENVLVAIMLDISLYHYFLLSDDLLKRKQFNIIKFGYICANNSTQDQIKIFGVKLENDNPIYLPISLKHVVKLSGRTNKGRRNEVISELVDNYADFLAESLSVKLEVDEQGTIINCQDFNNSDVLRIVEKAVKENANAEKFLIIIPENLTEKDDCIVVKYETDVGFVSWMNKERENTSPYQIIMVIKKGI